MFNLSLFCVYKNKSDIFQIHAPKNKKIENFFFEIIIDFIKISGNILVVILIT